MDLCPRCQTLLMVKGGRYSVEDETVYYTQEKYCSNSNCENHNKTVDIVKHKMN